MISLKPKTPSFSESRGLSVAYPNRVQIKVSVVMITFNEGRTIGRTLSKLQWCDEIVVVDSNSTDDTVSICLSYGCTVYQKPFSGYGDQKQYALSKANNDWVLCLDADEVLTAPLVDEIQQILSKPSLYSGYSLPMNLVFLDREFRHGRESGRHFIRLFNKRWGHFTNALVHEGIRVEGKTGKLKNHLLHYSYTSHAQWFEKCNRYSTLAAQEAVRKGKRKSLLAIATVLPYYFFRYYIVNGNFLNGREGFYWSVYSTHYHFAKYVKIMELYKCKTNRK